MTRHYNDATKTDITGILTEPRCKIRAQLIVRFLESWGSWSLTSLQFHQTNE